MLYIPLCTTPVPNDLNDDCKMDLLDFGVLAPEWMICNLEPTKACND